MRPMWKKTILGLLFCFKQQALLLNTDTKITGVCEHVFCV